MKRVDMESKFKQDQKRRQKEQSKTFPDGFGPSYGRPPFLGLPITPEDLAAIVKVIEEHLDIPPERKREIESKSGLPRQIAVSDEEHERFKLEAQAAAALNHNNIATVYEIHELEGEEFIVMEFIKGESLREKIAKGPLKLDEAVRIATEVADGLHEAHEHKIVHRDIKPANRMFEFCTVVLASQKYA